MMTRQLQVTLLLCLRRSRYPRGCHFKRPTVAEAPGSRFIHDSAIFNQVVVWLNIVIGFGATLIDLSPMIVGNFILHASHVRVSGEMSR